MKQNNAVTLEFSVRPARTRTRPNPSGSILATLLVAGAALVGPGAGFRAAAQFPLLPQNEPSVYSAGVFQVVVDTSNPRMVALMNPGTGANLALTYQYDGWNPVGGTLTSPLMFDATTQIAVSGAHQRESAAINQTYFPVQVGQNAGGWTLDQIPNYSGYAYPVPSTFTPAFDFTLFFPHLAGRDEVLTEIQKFTLQPIGDCGCDPSSNTCPPQVPPIGSMANLAVRAGYDNTYNGGAPFPTSANLGRSIGMVQSINAPQPVPSATDFPANSFFDINVEISLPGIPTSVSGAAFPAAGAVLLNDAPLLVASYIPTGPLPPLVVYTHTGNSALQPWGVNLKFRDTCAVNDPNTGNPYYYAGESLGTIVLAGHGTGLAPCSKGPLLNAFVYDVLGQPHQLAHRAVVARLAGSDSYPTPSSTYGSAPGTNFGGSSVDEVIFTNSSTLVSARSINIGNLLDSISLPAANGSSTYTQSNAVVTLETATDDIHFLPAQAVGLVQLLIVNTNPPTGNATTYYTELTALDVAGVDGFGSAFKLRKTPGKSSPGVHIVEPTTAGFKTGGYIDGSVDYGFNNGLFFKNPNRTIRMEELSVSTCGSATISLNISLSGSIATLTWVNASYRLEGRVSLAPTDSWVNLPFASPYHFDVTTTTNHYFRAVCP